MTHSSSDFSLDQLPASVRRAPELGQGDGGQAAPGQVDSDQGVTGPTWRVDVEDAESFQKLVQLSAQGAVVFALWAPHSPASVSLLEQMEELVNSASGNLLLAAVDITRLPEVGQAFQIQGVPAAVAVLGGRPAPLFNGQVDARALTEILGQVMQLAAQQGLHGGFEPVIPQEEKPLPPLHAEAIEALDRGDYSAAETAYRKALSEDPGDQDAKVGLAQVQLLERVAGLDAQAERQAAASNPTDVEAQLRVADLDLVGGHVEDAFNRLLTLFKTLDTQAKNGVRERLLELFTVVGAADPRVVRARSALMTALF